MPQNRSHIAAKIAGDFLTRCFQTGETIAILLRRQSPRNTVQRIVKLESAVTSRYLSWLAHENASGANIYVAANPICPGSRKRTKQSIAEIRRLYLDLDTDGDAKLGLLRSSNSVPVPSAIISTSSGKYQVLWRVDGFTFALQETTLKLLAIGFGGDPACTDCCRVLRVPGFLNQKYDPAQLVTVEYLSDSTLTPEDFRLETFQPEPRHLSDPIDARTAHGKRTNSERDWAWVLDELAQGKDALKLTCTLADRRTDKPNPLYYAQRTVDVASARLWLIEGVPISDIVTMLQVRRRFEISSSLCSARALEIALTAQRTILRKKIA